MKPMKHDDVLGPPKIIDRRKLKRVVHVPGPPSKPANPLHPKP